MCSQLHSQRSTNVQRVTYTNQHSPIAWAWSIKLSWLCKGRPINPFKISMSFMKYGAICSWHALAADRERTTEKEQQKRTKGKGQRKKDNRKRTTEKGQQKKDNRKRTTEKGQQRKDNRERTTEKGQQRKDNRERTTEKGQQRKDNRERTTEKEQREKE